MDAKQLKWAYLLVLSLIWGSSFILIKRGLGRINGNSGRFIPNYFCSLISIDYWI